MTRLAVLADIHGNLPAFEAALRHVSAQKVDQIILAGDLVIGSPDSKACWDLATSLGCPILRGNHERYVAHFGTSKASPEWSTDLFAPLQWTVGQLTAGDRQCMEQLPRHWRQPAAPDLLIVHASERDDHDTITAHTPEALLQTMFPTATERTIIRGHNHYGQTRIWDRGLIITAGSVGLALDGNPTAQYILIDKEKDGWKIRHQSVPYDVDLTAGRFDDTGYLAAVGPMGHLFLREVITASQQIVPFLRLYSRSSDQAKLSLPEAVDRFLSLKISLPPE